MLVRVADPKLAPLIQKSRESAVSEAKPLGALGPTMGPGKQLLVWTWQREVKLSAESVAATVGVPVPGNLTEMARRAQAFEDKHGPMPGPIGRTKSQAPAAPEPRWALSTESAEDSWGGNQVRRVLRDGKWAATAPTDVASEIVDAMNARETCPLAHDDASMAAAEKRAVVEALRAAAIEMHDNPELATENWSSWLLERADRIGRGEKP